MWPVYELCFVVMWLVCIVYLCHVTVTWCLCCVMMSIWMMLCCHVTNMWMMLCCHVTSMYCAFVSCDYHLMLVLCYDEHLDNALLSCDHRVMKLSCHVIRRRRVKSVKVELQCTTPMHSRCCSLATTMVCVCGCVCVCVCVCVCERERERERERLTSFLCSFREIWGSLRVEIYPS